MRSFTKLARAFCRFNILQPFVKYRLHTRFTVRKDSIFRTSEKKLSLVRKIKTLVDNNEIETLTFCMK